MDVKKLDNYFIRIVILNYNGSEYTVSLIKQIKQQTFNNYEIIVVDNGSLKEEVNILKKNISNDIKTIYSPKNLGYSAGNNLGLKYKEDREVDYFLVLNNDLILEDPNFINVMLNAMVDSKHLNVVASSPLVDTVSTSLLIDNQIQTRRLLSKWNTFLINIPLFKFYTDRKLAGLFLYENEKPYTNKYLVCDTINGAAFMIEKKFIVENDFLDEGTFLYYEEIILGRQIRNSKKTCLLNGNTSVKHLQGISSKSSANLVNVKMERFKYKSSLYYLKKYENLGFFASLFYVFLSEIVLFLKRNLNY